MADEKSRSVVSRSEGMPSGKPTTTTQPTQSKPAGKGEASEPRSKLEADQRTGQDPHPGNVSDFDDQVRREGPQRAEKLSAGSGELITEPVESAKDSAKIGAGPGVTPTGKATTEYKYQHVVLPVGPDGAIVPGPETAAIQACINAGYRPVGEPTVSGPEDHPDGISKIVTWSIPCVEATDSAWFETKE